MLSLFKHALGTWEVARGYIQTDLENLEVAINRLWGVTFGSDLKLKNEAIDGDGGVVRTGDAGNVTTGDVLLTDLEDIPADTVLGRRSASAGPVEVLTTTSPIAVSGTALIHNISGVVAGTYGSDIEVPVFTVDARGHITSVTDTAITFPETVSSPGHLHGLQRVVGDGVTTTYNLLDIAEYLEHVGVGGAFEDPATFSLSADRTQITFDLAPALGDVITVEYVIANA
jgi:hypothetical protein